MANEIRREMKTTTLGRSGLHVSRIAFGTWQLGGDWGTFDKDAAVSAIRSARELGVNFFDTAQAYGFGASEQILGKALCDELSRDRDELVIATKGGLRQTDSAWSAMQARSGTVPMSGAECELGVLGRVSQREAGRELELPLTSALLPRWHEALAGDHGGDDVASTVTAAATASPPGSRLSIAAPGAATPGYRGARRG